MAITNPGLPARDEQDLALLAASLLARLSELSITREYSVLKQRLQRTDPADGERYQEILTRLAQVQDKRRSLRTADEIGRASCRERVKSSDVEGRVKRSKSIMVYKKKHK